MKVRVQFTVAYEVEVEVADVPVDEVEDALDEIDFDQFSVPENQVNDSFEIEDFEVLDEDEGEE